MTNNQKNEKAGRLLEALGDVPDEMLEKASPESKMKKRPVWAYAAAAAAVVAVGGITTAVLMTREPQSMISGSDASADSSVASVTEDDSTPELPKIDAGINNFGAAGFEGVMYPGECEYNSANLWNESSDVQSLPVYRSLVRYDKEGKANIPFDSIRSDLTEQLKTVAAALGAELSDIDISDNGMTDEEIQKYIDTSTTFEASDLNTDPTLVEADTDKFHIFTDIAYQTSVWFNSGYVPEGEYCASTYDEALRTAEQLKSDYSELLSAVGITDPAVVVENGDYTFDGEQQCFIISFYDAGNSVEDSINNSAMKYVNFYGFEEHRLNGINIIRNDLRSEFVGDYPLLTDDEAAEQLKAGNYYTNVPLGNDYKPQGYAEVVLEYYVSGQEEYFVPYYRFFVDITDEISEIINTEMRTYGVFYVPAVRPEYLE